MAASLVRLRRDAGDHEGTPLERALRREVDGDVGFDRGTRALYATDASNYRQPPIGVVVPRTVDAAVTAMQICREQLRQLGGVRARHVAELLVEKGHGKP